MRAIHRASLLLRRRGRWRLERDGALAVGGDGRVLSAGPWKASGGARVVDHRPGVILAGFEDAHAHVPQWPVRGGDGRGGLLRWLRGIYDVERAFRGAAARETTARFVRALLAHGVTTAWLYGSAHPESAILIRSEARRAGLRAFVGHVLMDVDPYRDDLRRLPRARRTARVIDEAAAFRREPWFVATPRFAPSCTPDLLAACADFPRVQTHLAENRRECELVRRRFGRSYADVYRRAGLLKPGTRVAHCVHLTDREARQLGGAERVHCPTSNVFLRSGVMRWGRGGARLGSDVGAGWTLDPFEIMRCSLAQGAGAGEPELLAAAVAGSLEAGEPADFVVLDTSVLGAEPPDDGEALAARVVWLGGREAVKETWTGGVSRSRKSKGESPEPPPPDPRGARES